MKRKKIILFVFCFFVLPIKGLTMVENIGLGFVGTGIALKLYKAIQTQNKNKKLHQKIRPLQTMSPGTIRRPFNKARWYALGSCATAIGLAYLVYKKRQHLTNGLQNMRNSFIKTINRSFESHQDSP